MKLFSPESILRGAGVAAIVAGSITLPHCDAYADNSLHLVLNAASYHFSDENFNQLNLGAGAEYRSGKYYLTGGAYHNSEYRLGVYAGGGILGVGNKYARLGLEVGLVTGYESAPVVPYAAPVVRLGNHVKVLVLPPYKAAPLTLGLQFTF